MNSSHWWLKLSLVVFVLISVVGLMPVNLTTAQTDSLNTAGNSTAAASTESVSDTTSIAHEKAVVPIYFFHTNSCPHCAKEKEFLQELDKENDNIVVYGFELSNNRDYISLMQDVGKHLEIEVGAVPLTIIGNEAILGFQSNETTGEKIRETAQDCVDHECPDVMAELNFTPKDQLLVDTEQIAAAEKDLSVTDNSSPRKTTEQQSNDEPYNIELPLLGQLSTKQFSLPILTIIIALLDGFNPCAMWTLLFLISLLLGMKDRKRMWLLGTAFIFTSGLVYFLFLAAWLNLFLFLGVIFWVRLIIGIVAIAAGIYNLYDYCTNTTGGCHVTQSQQRQAVFHRLKEITYMQKLWLALAGIMLLAVAVNMVELICSAGLPAVFTQLLTLNNLPSWQYYGYLILYILIFMLDDLFVFIAAMTTLHMVGIEGKYSRYSRLIGGILILVIGILLLFKPEWLMFS